MNSTAWIAIIIIVSIIVSGLVRIFTNDWKQDCPIGQKWHCGKCVEDCPSFRPYYDCVTGLCMTHHPSYTY